jgi:DNA-binding transcriptional ArsR family regulator
MNDCIRVKGWQDGGMSLAVPVPVRTIDDAKVLRALSDPLRLSILRALMRGAHVEPRVMSAKELAAELGQPQTKLYRHLKQLEACKLIQTAETRIVSGIVEHRYRTGQLDLVLDPALGLKLNRNDAAKWTAALLDDARDGLLTAIAAQSDGSASSAGPVRAAYEGTLPPAKVQEFRQRLADFINELVETPEDHTGTPVRFVAVLYTPTPAPPEQSPRRVGRTPARRRSAASPTTAPPTPLS